MLPQIPVGTRVKHRESGREAYVLLCDGDDEHRIDCPTKDKRGQCECGAWVEPRGLRCEVSAVDTAGLKITVRHGALKELVVEKSAPKRREDAPADEPTTPAMLCFDHEVHQIEVWWSEEFEVAK